MEKKLVSMSPNPPPLRWEPCESCGQQVTPSFDRYFIEEAMGASPAPMPKHTVERCQSYRATGERPPVEFNFAIDRGVWGDTAAWPSSIDFSVHGVIDLPPEPRS